MISPATTAPKRQTVSLCRAAKMLGVACSTLRRRIDSGKLPAERTPGGQYAIQVDDVGAFRHSPEFPIKKSVYLPSPEEIAAECRAIQAGWTAEERYRRLRGILPKGQ